ncbi:MAG: WYL domain-containing protein [Thermodesulfobacteriota bacterium]
MSHKDAKAQRGYVSIRFTASSEPEVFSWILSYGEEAELLKPEHLLSELASKIRKMHQIYFAGKGSESPMKKGDRTGSITYLRQRTNHALHPHGRLASGEDFPRGAPHGGSGLRPGAAG